MLPVPLNSSKITSSARLPVSTSAVARIVRLPPSSMLRAVQKNFFGLISAFESRPPLISRPLARCLPVVAAREPRDRIQQDHDVPPSSTSRLARSPTISATWMWRAGGSSKVELKISASTSALEIRDFLRPLVHEQQDQMDLRAVARGSPWRCA